MKPPVTLEEWTECFDLVAEGTCDDEVLEAMRAGTYEWAGNVGVALNNVMVDAINRRIEKANHDFDKALFLEIPPKRTSCDIAPLVNQTIDRYVGTLRFITKVLGIRVVPFDRQNYICMQIEEIALGSHYSTVEDLRKYGHPDIAEMLEARPLHDLLIHWD